MSSIIVNIEGLKISLSESHIIVSKDNYNKLQQEASLGRYMTLTEVLEMLSVSRPWFMENILYQPDIRSKIDINLNKEGFVKYPKNQGGKYLFLASKTKIFFEQNFSDLLRGT